jgi:hypothetical protein
MTAAPDRTSRDSPATKNQPAKKPEALIVPAKNRHRYKNRRRRDVSA